MHLSAVRTFNHLKNICMQVFHKASHCNKTRAHAQAESAAAPLIRLLSLNEHGSNAVTKSLMGNDCVDAGKCISPDMTCFDPPSQLGEINDPPKLCLKPKLTVIHYLILSIGSVLTATNIIGSCKTNIHDEIHTRELTVNSISNTYCNTQGRAAEMRGPFFPYAFT